MQKLLHFHVSLSLSQARARAHTHTHINHISQSIHAASLQTTISLLKVKLHVINKIQNVQSGDCAVYCGKCNDILEGQSLSTMSEGGSSMILQNVC
jgi:hypothetical protein